VLGTLLLNLMTKLLPAQEAQGLFYGGTLILILLVARDGLLGLTQRWLKPSNPVAKETAASTATKPSPPSPTPTVAEPETAQ
jgi:hypothetical protein